jgi:hypothetical protein
LRKKGKFGEKIWMNVVLKLHCKGPGALCSTASPRPVQLLFKKLRVGFFRKKLPMSSYFREVIFSFFFENYFSGGFFQNRAKR